MLTLPEDLDPCDFLLTEGADAFRALVDRAVDPLAFAIDRAAAAVRLRLARGVAAGGRVGPGDPRPGPESNRGRARRQGGQGARHARRAGSACRSRPREAAPAAPPHVGPTVAEPSRPRPETSGTASNPPPRPAPIRLADLDPIDRELVEIVLNEPTRGRPVDLPGDGRLASRRPAACDPPGLLRPSRRGVTTRRSTGSPRGWTTRPCGHWRPACSCRSTRPPCRRGVRPGPAGATGFAASCPARRARPAGHASGT